MIATQARLLDVPMAALYPLGSSREAIAEANTLLVDRWQHRLGPVHRPFRQEAFVLELLGEVVAVAISASTVSDTVAGYRRGQVVELARLAGEPWATRVMLRLWREVCAPSWGSWRPQAAISYSHNAMHRGDLYRFDGWERVTDQAGKSGGGGAWSRPRYAGDVVKGSKTLWVWRYGAKSRTVIRVSGSQPGQALDRDPAPEPRP